MIDKEENFFQNVNELIAYLYTKVNHLSPLKLQKGLYFLYAYYSAMYGHGNKTEECEVNYNFPPNLFPAKFEAWAYGPVIRSVYQERKNGEENFQSLAKIFDHKKFQEENQEIQLFIDGLFSQIYQASDFALVDRSHEDKSWQMAFEQGQSTIISNSAIKDEYITKIIRK